MGKIALQSKFCLLQCVTFNFDLIFFFVFFSLFLLNSQRTTYDSLRIRIYHLIQYFQFFRRNLQSFIIFVFLIL